MDSTPFQSPPIENILENNFTFYSGTTTTDGVVYNHLQQAQSELKEYPRKASYKSIDEDSYISFEDFRTGRSSNDLSISQFMFDTPFNSNIYSTLDDYPYISTEFSQGQKEYLYHPLAAFPALDTELLINTVGQPQLSDQPLLAEPFESSTYLNDPPSFLIPSENHPFRTNSTPMLSTSFSFSSFSSSEDEADEKKHKKARKSKKSSLASSTMSDLAFHVAQSHMSDHEYDEEDDKKSRNVDKACNHCKRSHLRCDNARPCRRCVLSNKIGCQDVLHKPRGRPRLQKKFSLALK